jgi:hypothetical protein
MAREHQPAQAVFRSTLSEKINWEPSPGFPPSVREAVVVGDPTKPGLYLIRGKVQSSAR